MFGDRLKELREDKGLSQEQLADLLKISRSQLSNYETGKFEPNMEILIRIADFFGVSLDYLLCRTKTKYNIAFSKSKETFLKKFIKLLDEYM